MAWENLELAGKVSYIYYFVIFPITKDWGKSLGMHGLHSHFG